MPGYNPEQTNYVLESQNLDFQYLVLLKNVSKFGWYKNDRTGVGTYSVFNAQIEHDMQEGYPILTTKKMPFKTILNELIWFLRGDTNIKWLNERNCTIWNGDAYTKYLEFYLPKEYHQQINDEQKLNQLIDYFRLKSRTQFIDEILTSPNFAQIWGDLGPIYGKQWRNWKGTDQIYHLIYNLINNPDSRRLIVNAWNVDEINKMTLPPCHYSFQAYTRKLNKGELEDFKGLNSDTSNPQRGISLMVNMRSADLPLGLPFNITSYGTLLEIIAAITNMVPEKLIINIGDAHIYSNQVPYIEKQLNRNGTALPQIHIPDRLKNVGLNFEEVLMDLEASEFKLDGYNPHSKITIPLSN
jgi:thymidylate synthase